MKDVTIILVNYKTKDITINAIKSILKETKDINYEIILVDNNSNDGIIEEVNKLFPEIITIRSDKNLGFAGGCNLGSEYSKGKYLLFLNTDTILIGNTIKEMYEFMENHIDYGVIGTLLIDQKNNIIQSWGNFLPFNVGIKEFLIRPFLPKALKNNSRKENIKEFERKFFKDREAIEVDYIIGADMFVRKDIFEKIGKFDERFFMYFEEADLQIRIKKKGYKIGIVKCTPIIHLESISFTSSNKKRTMKMVSFLKYLRKNFPIYYIIFKPFSLVYGITKLLADLLLKEYTFRENLTFIKSLYHETFDFVK
ncbi:MAG: glycosyltransferase family 2 protein [Brevinematia bacterium]